MNHDTDDLDFRRRFAEVRSEDERTTPGFERILSRAPTRPRSPRWLVPAVALAGVAMVAAIWISNRRPAAAPWGDESAVDVAAWRSPTDALLKGTRLGWLGSVPRMTLDAGWLAVPDHGDTVNRN